MFASCIALLSMAIKGRTDSLLYYQTKKDTSVGGPFESSGSTSRYALTEAIVENHTFFLNDSQAQFASPDLARYNGKYFSLFTPGVSFLGVPFYVLGKLMGVPQLLSYSINIIAALLNILFIYLLARKLGAKPYSAILSGLIFIFATNALSYSLSYTQHLIAATIILASILNAISKRNLLNNLIFGFLIGTGLLVDIPIVVIVSPVIVYVMIKSIEWQRLTTKISFKVRFGFVGILISILSLLALFGWYNYSLTGAFSKIGQLIGRTSYLKPSQAQNKPSIAPIQPIITPTQPIITPVQKITSSVQTRPLRLLKTPYNPRLQLNGLYILLISNERGWLYYSPIVFAGLLGLLLKVREKENKTLSVLLLYVSSITVISYSMFGDPWGGWAFGPRYLIPAAGALCIGLGTIIDRFKKNVLFILIFFILLIYSVLINSLGALTTSLIPPKVEAVKQIPYTYEYNWQLVDKNFSSSLFYNFFLKNIISARIYLYIYSGAILILIAVIYLASVLDKRKEVKI